MIHFFEIDTFKTKEFVTLPLNPRQSNYNEIMWVQSGRANFYIDGDFFNVEANSFFIIPKDRYHQFLPKEAIIGKVIRFSEDELDKFPRMLFSKFNRISEVKIDDIQNKQFELLFEIFGLEIKELYNSTVILNLLKTIIYKLERIKQLQLPCVKNNKSDFDLFDKFQQLLDVYIVEHKNVEYYAQKLNVTTRKLNETVKNILNKTTIEVISERLLIESKRLLIYTDDSITNISYKLGFEDNSYFTKFFKKYTKLTPKEFISKHK